MGIAIVVPTIRLKESMPNFIDKWQELFDKHHITLITVVDGDKPYILYNGNKIYPPKHIVKLVGNYTAAVCNYGYWYLSKLKWIKYVIQLNDDVIPVGDPIQNHIDQLNRRVPISWMSNTLNAYMRGFPYEIRNEAPVMLSHGNWLGMPDLDAPTQLNWDGRKVEFYKGVIPKGALFPMSGMNVAFRIEALPYMFFAPVGDYKGAERFDDIWCGIEMKKEFDKLGWACVTGYSEVFHDRASNVYKSLEREAIGIKKNEEYWKGIEDEWFKNYKLKRKLWHDYLKE